MTPKIAWRLIGAVLLILALVGMTLFLLFANRWPVRFPGESPADYAMRRMRTIDNHVGNPEGSEVWVQTILSSGSEGMTILTEEVVVGRGEGTRFSPSPGGLLRRFGEAGRLRLHSEFYRLKAESLLSDEHCLARQVGVSFIVTTLMQNWSDESLLIEWTDLMALGNEAIARSNAPEETWRRVALRGLAANLLNNFVHQQVDPNCPFLSESMTKDEVDVLKKWVDGRRKSQE